MGREITIEPSAKQEFVMDSLGFEADSESHDYPYVTWRGYGIVVDKFKATDEIDRKQAMQAIIAAALEQGRNEVRGHLNKAFGKNLL